MRKVIFITWMPHCRRSDALAEALGGRSYLVHRLKFKQPFCAPLKYVLQTISTLRILFYERPDLVLVASPPFLAVVPVWFFAKIYRIPFVIDAHTGVFDNRRWRWSLPLSRFLSRRAALTIVTNKYLCEQVRRWDAKTMIIGDVPLDFPTSRKLDLGEGYHVVVINSFSDDEPLAEVLDAAKKISTVFLHITGDSAYATSAILQRASSNVRFTGWLSDEDYSALLRAADAVMVLTTRNHTMQRGAYEAMALAKPLITSDWPLLRKTFYLGTVHVSNVADDIARALVYTREENGRLGTEMGRLRLERQVGFQLKQRQFWRVLSPLLGKRRGLNREEFMKS